MDRPHTHRHTHTYTHTHTHTHTHTVELGYNLIRGTEYFVSLQTGVVLTNKYNVTVDSEELIGTTEYLTL